MATDLTPTTSLANIASLKRFGGVDDTVGSTPHDNVNSGAATLYVLEIDARNNTGENVYWKATDATSATVGTTQAHMMIKVRKGIKQKVSIMAGYSFGTGLSHWCVKGNAHTSSDAPSGSVYVNGMLA